MTWKLARSKPSRGRAEMQGSSVPLGRNHVSPSGAPSHRWALRIVLTFPPLTAPLQVGHAILPCCQPENYTWFESDFFVNCASYFASLLTKFALFWIFYCNANLMLMVILLCKIAKLLSTAKLANYISPWQADEMCFPSHFLRRLIVKTRGVQNELSLSKSEVWTDRQENNVIWLIRFYSTKQQGKNQPRVNLGCSAPLLGLRGELNTSFASRHNL